MTLGRPFHLIVHVRAGTKPNAFLVKLNLTLIVAGKIYLNFARIAVQREWPEPNLKRKQDLMEPVTKHGMILKLIPE
jgi:hypothetical protein